MILINKFKIYGCLLFLLANSLIAHDAFKKGNDEVLNNTPPDLPMIDIKINNNPSPGYFFFGLMPKSDTNTIYSNYLLISDNSGSTVAARKTGTNFSGLPLNFMQSPDGLMIHIELDPEKSEFFVSDTTLKPIDSLSYAGFQKYITYFKKLPNGNNILIKNELFPYDLSKEFEAGEPNAFISTSTVYELDKNKNIIFKWRALDNFNIKETYSVPKSWFHSHAQINGIILDTDGNFIISSKLLSEITKINRLTGEIMWRLGGANNQFEFINENQSNAPEYFSFQGDIRRLPNGNITLFDNGTRHNPQYSRCAEYKLDEIGQTAELIWEYRNTPDIYSSGYGSCQRQSNGNTVIGWGIAGAGGSSAVTEVTSDKTKAFEAVFPEGIYSTRALKYPINYGVPEYKKTEELLEKNTYKFREGTKSVCVSAKIIKLDAFFYAFLKGEKYSYAPMNADFAGPLPPVLFPKRIVLTPQEIDSLSAELRFDTKCLGITMRNNEYKIFRRDKSGSGQFVELPTTYDEATSELVTSTSNFGEFVFGIPWKVEKPMPPILNWPPNGGKVNYREAIYMECSPRGYFKGCTIQIANDKEFKVVVYQDSTYESVFNRVRLILPGEYYWRVRSFIDTVESDWSEPYSFYAGEPFMDITFPDGGEVLKKDTLRKIIRWDKNVYDSVKVELFRNNELAYTIHDTLICFTGAFAWIIPNDIVPDSTYRIRVTSLENNSLVSESESDFTIADGITTVEDNAYGTISFMITPNPVSDNANISFSIDNHGLTEILIYDLLGNRIESILKAHLEPGSHSISHSFSNLMPGTYYCKMITNGKSHIFKFVIIR